MSEVIRLNQIRIYACIELHEAAIMLRDPELIESTRVDLARAFVQEKRPGYCPCVDNGAFLAEEIELCRETWAVDTDEASSV